MSTSAVKALLIPCPTNHTAAPIIPSFSLAIKEKVTHF